MVKDKEHGESLNAQKLRDWLKPCDLKSKSRFLLCVCWVFELLSPTWFILPSYFFALWWAGRRLLVQVRLSGLDSRSSSIGKDTKQSELITRGELEALNLDHLKSFPSAALLDC